MFPSEAVDCAAILVLHMFYQPLPLVSSVRYAELGKMEILNSSESRNRIDIPKNMNLYKKIYIYLFTLRD